MSPCPPAATTSQGRGKVWKSEGASSYMVVICCPPGWDRVKWFAKIWGGMLPPAPPAPTASKLDALNALLCALTRKVNQVVRTSAIFHFSKSLKGSSKIFIKGCLNFVQKKDKIILSSFWNASQMYKKDLSQHLKVQILSEGHTMWKKNLILFLLTQ